MLRATLIGSVLLALGVPALPVLAADEDEPIVLDLRNARRKADGSYEIESPVKQTEDGQLEFSSGKRLSMKRAMEQHIASGNARGPDGKRIDPNEVIVNEDGSISRRDGSLLSREATGGPGDFSVTSGGGDGLAELSSDDDEQQQVVQAGQEQPRQRPASAVGGIELISGGSSKDGVATVGEIPVLR